MSGFVLIHADAAATLIADDPIVPAAAVPRLTDAAALLAAATSLRQRARDGAADVVAAARSEGFAAGQAEGRAAGEAEMRDTLLRLAGEDAARAERQRGDLARLALEVVRRIAGEIGEGAVVAGMAARAAAAVAPDTPVTVRVAPAARAAVTERLAGLGHVTVEEDAALAADDCVLVTSLGQVRAGLDTQLAQLARSWGLP